MTPAAITRALICTLALFGSAQAQEPDKVLLAVVPSLANTPFYVADARGYFTAEHIAIDTSGFRGSNDAVSALATGQLDGTMGAMSAGFFNAANRGLDMRIVASLGINPDVSATPLMVRTDLVNAGTIKTGADLRGRRVAVNTPGGPVEYFLSVILAKHGMTLKDIDEVTIGFPEMVAALSNKSIDAALVTAPFSTYAAQKNDAIVLPAEEKTAAGEMSTAVLFSGRILRERPKVAEAFLRAMIRGSRDTQGAKMKSPEITRILSDATKIPPDIVNASIGQVFDPNLALDPYMANIRSEEQVYMKNGRISYTTPLPDSAIVAADPVRNAAASLGPYKP